MAQPVEQAHVSSSLVWRKPFGFHLLLCGLEARLEPFALVRGRPIPCEERPQLIWRKHAARPAPGVEELAELLIGERVLVGQN